jgi:hypothetical protein
MIDYPDSSIANSFFTCTEVFSFYIKVITVSCSSIVYFEWGMEGRRDLNDVLNCTVFLYHCILLYISAGVCCKCYSIFRCFLVGPSVETGNRKETQQFNFYVVYTV